MSYGLETEAIVGEQGKVRNGVEFLWGDTYYGIYLDLDEEKRSI